MNPSEELKRYIAEHIFPRYKNYYSHGMSHIDNVIENMMMLADYYDLNRDMAYATASYHDIGLDIDRENHEKESAKVLENDKGLKEFFTARQIKTMAEAIEDHRGSRKEKPRNIYGECISDSDRDFSIPVLAKRQLATSLRNYPNLTTFEEHFERCYEYICRRINKNGVFNLWTNNPVLVERRDEFQKEYLNKDFAREIYAKEWDRISSDGTKERIMNFYEDY